MIIQAPLALITFNEEYVKTGNMFLIFILHSKHHPLCLATHSDIDTFRCAPFLLVQLGYHGPAAVPVAILSAHIPDGEDVFRCGRAQWVVILQEVVEDRKGAGLSGVHLCCTGQLQILVPPD